MEMRRNIAIQIIQLIVQLYQTCNNFFDKVWIGLTQLKITLLIFQSINSEVVAIRSNY